MRVLIVGCGYVGLPLGMELVRRGHRVFGTRRSAAACSQLKAAGIEPLQADLTKPDDLTEWPSPFDWVVNCAASGGGTVDDYRRVYLQGTRNLLGWLGPTPPVKYVYTSSTSVYGQNDGSLVTEDSPTEPAAQTGRVLVEAEKLLRYASLSGDLPTVILRVAAIYGPDRGHAFRQFLRNEARLEGKGERFLNMIHRDDVIGCVIAALQDGRAGEVYNAVDDEPARQLDFFQWLARALGRALPPSAPLNPDGTRKRGGTNKRVSNLKLTAELGYRFKYPTFRQGYAEEILRLQGAGALEIKPRCL